MERHGTPLSSCLYFRLFIYSQGWRGSVKARHFVMGLRDHFHDKWNIGNRHKHLANAATADIPPDTPTTGQNADQWALAFISIVRLQPVREAFDDDASGFVTVAEANAFTRSRPLGWRYDFCILSKLCYLLTLDLSACHIG